MAELLNLNEKEKIDMYDLAAGEKENSISPDLPEYIMGTKKARAALRMAGDTGATDDTWQKIIDMLEREQNGECSMRYYEYSPKQLEEKATELLIEFDKERLTKIKPIDVYAVIEKCLNVQLFYPGAIC